MKTKSENHPPVSSGGPLKTQIHPQNNHMKKNTANGGILPSLPRRFICATTAATLLVAGTPVHGFLVSVGGGSLPGIVLPPVTPTPADPPPATPAVIPGDPLATPILKTYKIGGDWFGGDNRLEISESTLGGKYSLKAEDTCTGHLLRLDFKLAHFEGRLGVDSTAGTGSIFADADVVGQNLIHLDEKFTSAKTWTISPITREIQTGSLTFSIFGLPASISASASVSAGAEAKASLDPEPVGLPSLHASGGPTIDSAVHATGKIEAFVLSGGVSGDLSLIKDTAAGDVKFTPASKQVCYGLTNTIRTADGVVSGWIQVRVLFWKKKFTRTLWERHSDPKTETLATGCVTL